MSPYSQRWRVLSYKPASPFLFHYQFLYRVAVFYLVWLDSISCTCLWPLRTRERLEVVLSGSLYPGACQHHLRVFQNNHVQADDSAHPWEGHPVTYGGSKTLWGDAGRECHGWGRVWRQWCLCTENRSCDWWEREKEGVRNSFLQVSSRTLTKTYTCSPRQWGCRN